jgi:hypothetical protein
MFLVYSLLLDFGRRNRTMAPYRMDSITKLFCLPHLFKLCRYVNSYTEITHWLFQQESNTKTYITWIYYPYKGKTCWKPIARSFLWYNRFKTKPNKIRLRAAHVHCFLQGSAMLRWVSVKCIQLYVSQSHDTSSNCTHTNRLDIIPVRYKLWLLLDYVYPGILFMNIREHLCVWVPLIKCINRNAQF